MNNLINLSADLVNALSSLWTILSQPLSDTFNMAGKPEWQWPAWYKFLVYTGNDGNTSLIDFFLYVIGIGFALYLSYVIIKFLLDIVF